jgi:hypothetical protein
MSKEKAYRVHCYETVDAVVTILAESPEDARSKVWDMISEQGMPTEAGDLVQDINVVNREFNTMLAEEIKEN